MPILNLADMGVGILLLYYLVSGWLRGFWLSMLGPVSFAACSILAYQYYRENHNIYLGFAVVFLGPIFLRVIVGFSLWVFREEGEKPRPNYFSSLFGAAISLTWGITITALVLFMLGMAPEGFHAPLIKKEVLSSRSYHFLAGRLAKAWPAIFTQPPDPKTVVSPPPYLGQDIVMPTEEERQKIEAIPEYQNLMQDERIIQLVEDPKTLEMIKSKNYTALLEDENFAKILEDPQLIMQLLQLYQKMGQQAPGPNGQPPVFPPETGSFSLPSVNNEYLR